MSTDFTLHFDPVGEVLDGARACEASVFLQQYGNTADEWAEEYGPYDASSVFIAITDPLGDVVAAMRIIVPSLVGLKTLVDVGRAPWDVDGERAALAAGMDLERTWDVATLAVRKRVRGGALLSAALYHALVAGARVNDARWLVMIMDVRARRLLHMLDLQTGVLPGTFVAPYLGSAESVPVWTELAPMFDAQRRVNPDAFRLISLGVGLDGISLPAPAAFALKRPALVGLAAAPFAQLAISEANA